MDYSYNLHYARCACAMWFEGDTLHLAPCGPEHRDRMEATLCDAPTTRPVVWESRPLPEHILDELRHRAAVRAVTNR